MIQTIREQLKALVTQCELLGKPSGEWIVNELKDILAASPPDVSVKPGWVCKGKTGLKLCIVHPHWYENINAWGTDYAYQEYHADGIITDPWETSHPNGGLECLLEVMQ